MFSVGNNSMSVACRKVVSVHCWAKSKGKPVNSDFISNHTTLWSEGICIILMALIKLSVDCNFRLHGFVGK